MSENIFPSDLWEIHNMEFSLYTRIPRPRLLFFFLHCEEMKMQEVVLP